MKKYTTISLRSFVILIASLSIVSSYCQEVKNQYSVAAGGFFSPVSYNLKSGDVKNGYGFSFGFRYSYYLSNSMSIGLGAEYQNFNSSAEIDLLKGSYMATDSEGEEFEFRYNASGVKEKQSLKYITIPVNFQFEGTGYPGFYASVGAKIGVALKSTYETTIDNLSTSGYYPQYDVELFDPQFAGFGNFGKVEPGKQDLDVSMSYIATAEIGIKREIDEASALYIGLYIDYGLNDVIKKDDSKQVVQYSENIPVNFKYNSVLETSYAGDVKVMSYGLKVRYALW